MGAEQEGENHVAGPGGRSYRDMWERETLTTRREGPGSLQVTRAEEEMGGREEEEVGNGVVGGRIIYHSAVWADKSELERLAPVCRGMSNALVDGTRCWNPI